MYARKDEPYADESARLVEPRELSEYPDAKAAAELNSAVALGDRLLIARPGLIAGAGDPSDRFGYWPARLSRPGPVLVPEVNDRYVQVIDVEDLARWIVRAGQEEVTGTVNAVGEVHQMQSFFAAAAPERSHGARSAVRECISFLRGHAVFSADDAVQSPGG